MSSNDSIPSRSGVERDTNAGPAHLGAIEDDGLEGRIIGLEEAAPDVPFAMMSDDSDEDEKARGEE